MLSLFQDAPMLIEIDNITNTNSKIKNADPMNLFKFLVDSDKGVESDTEYLETIEEMECEPFTFDTFKKWSEPELTMFTYGGTHYLLARCPNYMDITALFRLPLQ